MGRMTSEEQGLVNEAIAKGRVEVVPPGISGLPLPVWNKTKRCLLYPDRAQAKSLSSAGVGRLMSAGIAGVVLRRQAQKKARMERLKSLFRPGMTLQEAADALGVCLQTIVNYNSELQLPFMSPAARAAARRRADLVARAGPDPLPLSLLRELAAAHGVSERTLREDARALGLKVRRGRPGRPSKGTPERPAAPDRSPSCGAP